MTVATADTLMQERAQGSLKFNRSVVLGLGLLIVLCVAGAILVPGFASFANLRSMLLLAAFLGLASLGQTLCALLGGIDMSIPYVIGSANILLASLFNLKVPLFLACLVVVLAGALVGTINGVLSFRAQGQSLIMTLGVGFSIVGATQIVTSIGSVGLAQERILNRRQHFWSSCSACHLHLDHRIFSGHPRNESNPVWKEFLRGRGEPQSGSHAPNFRESDVDHCICCERGCRSCDRGIAFGILRWRFRGSR
jgi:hypothetical protein